MNTWLLIVIAWLLAVAVAAMTGSPLIALVAVVLGLAALRVPAQALLRWLASRP
jgi:predicted tellurium resistance membrane protein TerC